MQTSKGIGLNVKIILGFAVVLALTAALGGYAYSEFLKIETLQAGLFSNGVPDAHRSAEIGAEIGRARTGLLIGMALVILCGGTVAILLGDAVSAIRRNAALTARPVESRSVAMTLS
jgi:hypothetical protein